MGYTKETFPDHGSILLIVTSAEARSLTASNDAGRDGGNSHGRSGFSISDAPRRMEAIKKCQIPRDLVSF